MKLLQGWTACPGGGTGGGNVQSGGPAQKLPLESTRPSLIPVRFSLQARRTRLPPERFSKGRESLMERLGAEWLRADSKLREHLNSQPQPDLENQSVLASAYRDLGLSFNSPAPDWERFEAPENTLDPESYSRGWEGAIRPQGKPWL